MDTKRLPAFHTTMDQVETIIARGHQRAQAAADQGKSLPGYKQCTKCKRMLRLTEVNFHQSTKSADGFSSVCKACNVRYIKMRRTTGNKFNKR